MYKMLTPYFVGITIDYSEDKIIWVDAKLDTIETADLDGQNRRVRIHWRFTVSRLIDSL